MLSEYGAIPLGGGTISGVRLVILLLASAAFVPGVAVAQIDSGAGKPGQGAPSRDPKPAEQTAPADAKPIVPNEEFS